MEYSLLGFTVAGKYLIEKKIGKGSFGEIYEAINLSNNSKVGIKVEVSDHQYPQLMYEAKVYDDLRGGPGIPYLYWYGVEAGFNFLVMDLLGLSLEALLERCGRHFSLKTVLLIADQAIARLEYFHSNYYIHRDIKPENFVMGTESRSNFVYIIDYGLCKKYINWRTNEHIPYIEGKALTGTARYASISTHLGIEQSRRDDLEGLAYVLIYMLKGKLPWQDISVPEKVERYEAIKNLKINTSINELCYDIPDEFSQFLSYTKSIEFEQTPDYAYMKRLFKNLIYKSKYETDYIYDWVLLNNNDPNNTKIKKK